METCKYEDKISNCEREVYCKGLCSTHYQQQRQTGRLTPARDDIPVRMRYMSYVLIKVDGSECWEWQGCTARGYGQFRFEGKIVYAHRFAWEKVNGTIPEDMMVDHICHNPLCVNVEHLRLATAKENIEHHNGPSSRSTTGVRGVWWNKRLQKYCVESKHNGKNYSGGYFTDLAEAEQAAKDLRNRLHTFNDNDRV